MTTSWTSWSGLSTARPVESRTPHHLDDVVAAVASARERGLHLKMPGSGHSFSDVAVTDGVLLHPGGLTGIVAVDRAALTVTALAGTPLRELNAGLVRLGLSLHNMGDVEEQTLAGAISTGTHGTGGTRGSLSAQVVGLELVTGTGEVLHLDRDEHPDLLAVARVGLGALGVLTSVTVEVEPLFTLEAHEAPLRWDEALGGFDQRAAEHHHVEMYWFPHTDRLLSKVNDRVLEDPAPLSRFREWWDDQFLSNRVFSLTNRVGNRVPRAIPRINDLSARALGERRYSDVPHRVFTTRRTVRFREMEYAVPREAGLDALRDVRRLVERSGWRIGFPVEYRVTPADDVPLSPAHGRDTAWIAVHVNAASDHTDYFAGVEAVLRAHDGRPHWGKLHTRTAADLAPAYDRWDDVLAARDRLDPDRLFANPYLDRVLGP
ncbi:FAD-linked oxidoreductase [Nocardioides scoriae]|uniref:FAD-linked oxidoreductase n=1 Tax=Nocardioides scoriae TaxID=642780 RepID=A0A1H1Q6S7_9ACTN|nr:D-arabinono-1,4-lactone oxidase [Nocardioides scoriae]SDS18967.1 FAD-linked oxidoreductase [Nocardioides scoriae]